MSQDGRIERLDRFCARRYWILLLGILALGLGLRIATYHGLRAADPAFYEANLDSRYFLDWADRIVEGDPLAEKEEPRPRPFFMNPLYPYFLSVFVAGFDDVMLAVRIAQILLGVLTILLVADAARRLAGPGTGLVAGLITSMYPLLLYYEQRLMIVTLAVFLNALAVWFLAGLRSRPTVGAALLAGLPLGLSVLARPNVILFAALLPLWFLLLAPAGRRIRFALSRSVVLLLGIILMTLPVTLRNLIVGKEFVWVTWSMGVNLWQSNNPAAREAGWMFSEELRHNPWFMKADAIRIAETEIARREIAGSDLSIAEVDAWWRERARREIARRRLEFDPPAWKALAAAELGREPAPREVEAFARGEARKRLAMRGIARRELARIDLACQAEGRQLTHQEVSRHWSGREITERQVDEYWGDRLIPAADIDRAWRRICDPGTESGPDKETVDRYLGDREPTSAEIHELLEPLVDAYRARSGEGPREAQRREISSAEVERYWGDRSPTDSQVEAVTSRAVKEYWRGREVRVSDVSTYWSWRTRQSMLAEPGPAVIFLLRKFLYGLRGFEMPSTYYFAVDRPRIVPLKWLPFRFLYISPLMLLGCILVLKRRQLAMLFALLVAAYLVGLTVFYPLAHYRAPMLPAALPLAAIALVRLTKTLIQGPGKARLGMIGALATCILIANLSNLVGLLGGREFAGYEDDRVIHHVNSGMFFLDRGDLGAAEDAFRKATEAAPETHYGWKGRAAVAEARGLFETEALYLELALETTRAEPMSEEAARRVYGRWQRLLRDGRIAEAESVLWQAVREKPGSVLPRIWLAKLAAMVLPPEAWKSRVLQAMAKRPDQGELWALLGANWADRGLDGPGMLMLREATRQSPHSFRVHSTLADNAFDRGDYRQALSSYQRALELVPHSDPLALANLSRCHRMLGDPEGAESAIRRASEVDPDHPAVRLERVLLDHSRGQADLEDVRRVVEQLRASGETMPGDVRRLLGEE